MRPKKDLFPAPKAEICAKGRGTQKVSVGFSKGSSCIVDFVRGIIAVAEKCQHALFFLCQLFAAKLNTGDSVARWNPTGEVTEKLSCMDRSIPGTNGLKWCFNSGLRR